MSYLSSNLLGLAILDLCLKLKNLDFKISCALSKVKFFISCMVGGVGISGSENLSN